MTKEPKRLFDEDRGVAHLVAASDKDGPSSAQMQKLLSLATDPAAARRTPWRWTGPSFAVGIAFIGAAVLGVAAGAAPSGSRTDTAPATASPTALPAEALGGDRPAEAAVMTVSIHDLAPAPSSSSGLSVRGAPAKALAPFGPTRIASAALSSEGAAPGSHDARNGGELATTRTGRTTFDEELELVSAARSALQRGDVPSCMRSVEAYCERFGAGTFAQEIEVIRIEGMMTAGERTRARAAAETFLASHAASPYADRVRSLLDRMSR